MLGRDPFVHTALSKVIVKTKFVRILVLLLGILAAMLVMQEILIAMISK